MCHQCSSSNNKIHFYVFIWINVVLDFFSLFEPILSLEWFIQKTTSQNICTVYHRTDELTNSQNGEKKCSNIWMWRLKKINDLNSYINNAFWMTFFPNRSVYMAKIPESKLRMNNNFWIIDQMQCAPIFNFLFWNFFLVRSSIPSITFTIWTGCEIYEVN